MMHSIQHIMEMLVNPFFLCVVLIVLSTVLLWVQVSVRFSQILMMIVCILLLLISTGWVPRFVTNRLENQYPVISSADPKINWIVVLGGGQGLDNGMPANDMLTNASIKRLVEGVRLIHMLPNAKLVLSGGSSSGERNEAELLAHLARWFNIPEEKIVLEQNSINTEQQAQELKNIVHQDSFYLVTSAIHMPRSIVLCKRYDLNPIAAPTDFTLFWDSPRKLFIPNTYNLNYFSIALHELLGRFASSLVGTVPGQTRS